MWQPLEILNDFNTLTFKQIVWKAKTFFKNLSYRFLVESTKIESTSFPYKTDISEANVRQIEWWVQNGTITKNGVLPVTTLVFWKFWFSLRTSCKELIWCTNDPNVDIPAFYKGWSFIWRWFFPVSILNKRVKYLNLCLQLFSLKDINYKQDTN